MAIPPQYTQNQGANVGAGGREDFRAKKPTREVSAQRAGDHRFFGERQKYSHEYRVPKFTLEMPALLQVTG
ncbi:uncharacterized protein EAF02_003742 [Botrytis sinoallii]|uniref:uncharacterized protein n=1 Tax=Botrytis sinoallii TaxID=1463999 RepID=UPI00190227C1|nr:uncharacterized protein EAF02_003742 [Botrytis sinoallii]KAF7887095.1 hypothetical protein EAF02_003742 [Botrytis sinoallii]